MKTFTGICHESPLPEIDPTKFYEQSRKNDPVVKVNPDIENKTFQWSEVWQQFSSTFVVEQPKSEHKHTGFKQRHDDLVHQCQVLKDIVAGMIVGDRNTVAMEQQHQYNTEIANIVEELSQIELSQQYRELTNPQYQAVQLKELQNKIQSLNLQTSPEGHNQPIRIANNNTEAQMTALQKRLATIETMIGIQTLQQSGKGRDFILSNKGVPLFSSNNVLESKAITFKPLESIHYTGPQYQIEAMPILQHLKFLKTSTDIIQGMNVVDSELTTQTDASKIHDALEHVKQYEQPLLVSQDIPYLVDRLKSLKAVHDESVIFPNQLSETQNQILSMKSQLQETLELLSLLDKDIDENVEILNQNLDVLLQKQ